MGCPRKKFCGTLVTLLGTTVFRQMLKTAIAAHTQLHFKQSFSSWSALLSMSFENFIVILYAGRCNLIIHFYGESKTILEWYIVNSNFFSICRRYSYKQILQYHKLFFK